MLSCLPQSRILNGVVRVVRIRAYLLVAEAVLCFALPAYILFWGIVTSPLWFSAATRGGTYAIWTLAYTIGGCLGIAAVVAVTRYLVSSSGERKFAATRNVLLGTIGLASIWGTVTDDFRLFEINPFVVALAVMPSLCFVHFLILAFRKSSA